MLYTMQKRGEEEARKGFVSNETSLGRGEAGAI